MELQRVSFGDQSHYSVDAQLGLDLTIADVLTEIEHALVLSDVLDFLLEEAQLMQCHLEVVEEVGHRIKPEVEVTNVLLEDFGTFQLLQVLSLLVVALIEYFLRFSDFPFEYADVLL